MKLVLEVYSALTMFETKTIFCSVILQLAAVKV